MKKNNYLIFLLFLLVFLGIGNTVLGLEVNSLGLGKDPTLPQYINVIFTWLIGIGVTASMISFVVGAFGLIIPNPESHGEAKNRMKSAIFGLFIVLSCFVVLKTINIKLVEIGELSKIDDIAGVFYTNGSNLKTAPQENADLETVESEFRKLKYMCSGGKGDPIFVWKFNEKNFGSLESATVKEVKCGDTAEIGSASFKWAFKSKGIYFCLGGCSGTTCTGMSTAPMQLGRGPVDSVYEGKIQSVVFVKDEETGDGYGAIFHKTKSLDQAGFCNSGNTSADGTCVLVNNSFTYSADLFKVNSKPETSGDGVNFFSGPFGWNAGSDSGYYEVAANQISSPKMDIEAEDIEFGWSGTETTETYQMAHDTFKKSPGSVQVRGSYIVMLTSKSRFGSGSFCKTYIADVPDLAADPVTNVGEKIENIIIFPISD